MTRRTLLTRLPLLPLLLRPALSAAQSRFVPSAHPLNHPAICLGWWLAQPMSGGSRWIDLVHGRVGILTNMAAPVTNSSGYHLQTYRLGGMGETNFDGTNDVAVLPALLNNPVRMSFSLWLQYTDVVRQGIISKAAAYNGPNPGWYLRNHTNGAEGNLGFWLNETPGTTERGGIVNQHVADGIWHHVVVTMAGWTPSTDWMLWIDARPQTFSFISVLGTITSLANTEPVRLGGFGDGLNAYHGALDDVRLYHDYILSSRDVSTLYTQPRHGYRDLLAGPLPVAPTLAVTGPRLFPRRGLFLGVP